MRKNNKGFTLVEVIISIAALGIICAVLLRLFVIAGDTSDRAGNIQHAELCVTSTVETLVSSDTIYDGLGALDIDCSDDIVSAEFAYTRDGYDIAIDIEERDGGYPGTLYNLQVSASDGDDELASVSTATYYKEQAHD
ncbi:MAG: type II secretion system protein [Eubacteriales bacterium]|nr:type II secretion system protein [Eubacteriales bacterium]